MDEVETHSLLLPVPALVWSVVQSENWSTTCHTTLSINRDDLWRLSLEEDVQLKRLDVQRLNPAPENELGNVCVPEWTTVTYFRRSMEAQGCFSASGSHSSQQSSNQGSHQGGCQSAEDEDE
ncbi:unnamed protein product [Pleuronectes platessa]|uniref:Uncharacterized protein n=1 Tax=Pleuronectes platessa TaxID=8262 RepID=A0A9N7UD36_PLEPL|nr:unnamed protein product [Pleuronectes platessa]